MVPSVRAEMAGWPPVMPEIGFQWPALLTQIFSSLPRMARLLLLAAAIDATWALIPTKFQPVLLRGSRMRWQSSVAEPSWLMRRASDWPLELRNVARGCAAPEEAKMLALCR